MTWSIVDNVADITGGTRETIIRAWAGDLNGDEVDAGVFVDAGGILHRTVVTETDSAGDFTLSGLTPNADLTPDGVYYWVRVGGRNGVTFGPLAGADGETNTLLEANVSDPDDLETLAFAAHIANPDAHRVETLTGAAIQAALDALPSGGGEVRLAEGTFVLTEPIVLPKDAALTGAGIGTILKVDDGADCTAITIGTEGDGGRRNIVSRLKIDGNRANQSGLGTSHGIHAIQTWWLWLDQVWVTSCDGHGVFTTGMGSITRHQWVTDLIAEDNAEWGIRLSSATREIFYDNLVARENLKTGIEVDHSQGQVSNLFAIANEGDGIYVHNVQQVQGNNWQACNNAGFGIYVEAMVHSTIHGLVAGANCHDTVTGDAATSTYRAGSRPTAEVFLDRQASSYGRNRRLQIHGISAPGDMSFNGPNADNRSADWGVYIDDNVTEDVSVTGIMAGDGGLEGDVRVPKLAANTESLHVEVHPSGSGEPMVRRRGQSNIGQGPVRLYLPGTTGSDARCVDNAAFTPSTELEVRALVQLADWTPGSALCIASQWDDGAGQRAWRFVIPNTGAQQFRLAWSDDGTSGTGSVSGAVNASVNTDGVAAYIAAHLALATGQVTWRVSHDGVHWDDQDTLPAAVGATSIFDSSAPLIFGDVEDGGGSNPLQGYVSWGQLLVDGAVVAEADLTLGLDTWRDQYGNTWSRTGDAIYEPV